MSRWGGSESPEYSTERAAEVARPVLGSEMIEDDEAPTVLYLPTAAQVTSEELAFVLRELEDGRRALLVFTSLERLVEGCGDEQPWVSIRADALTEFEALTEPDVLLWDAVLAPAIRQYSSYERLAKGQYSKVALFPSASATYRSAADAGGLA